MDFHKSPLSSDDKDDSESKTMPRRKIFLNIY